MKMTNFNMSQNLILERRIRKFTSVVSKIKTNQILKWSNKKFEIWKARSSHKPYYKVIWNTDHSNLWRGNWKPLFVSVPLQICPIKD